MRARVPAQAPMYTLIVAIFDDTLIGFTIPGSFLGSIARTSLPSIGMAVLLSGCRVRRFSPLCPLGHAAMASLRVHKGHEGHGGP